MKELYEFLSLNENEIKIDYILKILLALSITKDKYSLERYKHILGYPNPIICEIPRKNNDDKDDEDEPSPSPSPSSPTQNFPIFGEKLINGNLDKHIYEFVNINRRKKSFCLLKLLNAFILLFFEFFLNTFRLLISEIFDFIGKAKIININ